MSEAQRISFKNVGSGNSAASSAPAPATGTVLVDEVPKAAVDVSAALAPRPADAPVPAQPPGGSYFGGEDEQDAEDVRNPYLNLVQPTSKPPLSGFGLGNFVLAKDTLLGSSFTAVVVGFSKARYAEKVKWGQKGKVFGTIEEVAAIGGTTKWYESKENEKANSKKPFFDTVRTALLLVQQPDGVKEDRFVELLDGKRYSVCALVVKGMSYDSFYVTLNTEQKTGLLRAGFYTRFVKVKADKASATSEALKIVAAEVGDKVGAEVTAKALALRS